MEQIKTGDQQREKEKNLELFKEELKAGIEFIQSIDFLVESEQISEDDAKQVQIIFEDFDSWAGVSGLAETADIIKSELAVDQDDVQSYNISGAEDVGDIEVNVYTSTKEDGVNLVQFKYEDGTAVYGLRPVDYQEIQ